MKNNKISISILCTVCMVMLVGCGTPTDTSFDTPASTEIEDADASTDRWESSEDTEKDENTVAPEETPTDTEQNTITSENNSPGVIYHGSSSHTNTTPYEDTYDDGYDDVYMDGDYDLDRYYEDDDYASGVDDAIEDDYEEYGEEW